MDELHLNSRLPRKKPRGGQLAAEDKAYNRTLARERVVIEQVNRCLKIFRILAERYRNRRRRFGLRCNLIAVSATMSSPVCLVRFNLQERSSIPRSSYCE